MDVCPAWCACADACVDAAQIMLTGVVKDGAILCHCSKCQGKMVSQACGTLRIYLLTQKVAPTAQKSAARTLLRCRATPPSPCCQDSFEGVQPHLEPCLAFLGSLSGSVNTRECDLFCVSYCAGLPLRPVCECHRV